MALIKGKVSKIQRLFAEKIKAKKRKFYRPPAVRQRWDEEQEELENTWGELFFDLIFVAVAFKVGDLIVADFELGKYDRGLLFAYSTFVILYDAWQDRTLFLSRFVTDDSFHKLLDIISGFVTAVMAFSIVTPEEFLSMGEGRFNYALMLSSGKIIQLTIDMFKMWEFRYFSNHREQGITLKQHVTPTMSVTFRNYYIAASLITVAIYTSYIGYIRTTCFLWLASSIVPRQITFLAVLYWRNYQRSIRAKRADTEEERDRINSEGSGVPINVQFFIDRLYEFVMLLNGEGVLQVIILPITFGYATTHLVSFVLAFIILSLIQFIQFEIMPAKAEDSVVRRSRWRAPIMFFFWPIFCLSIIYVGISLKLVLKNHYKLDKAEYAKNSWLLCSSLAFAFMLLIFTSMLNLGPYELVFNEHFSGEKKSSDRNWRQIRSQCGIPNNVAVKRIAVYLVLFLSPLSLLTLPPLKLSGEFLLGSCVGILLVIAALTEIHVRSIRRIPDETDSQGEEVNYVLEDKSEYDKDDINRMFDVWRDRAEDLVNNFNNVDENRCKIQQANALYNETETLKEMLNVISENVKTLLPVNLTESASEDMEDQLDTDETFAGKTEGGTVVAVTPEFELDNEI